MDLIIALCEGVHDVAFLSRILKTAGFKNKTGTKLNQFPPVIGNYLKAQIEGHFESLEQLNLHQKPVLPSYILQKGEQTLFLFALGGDSKIKATKDVIQAFSDLAENDLDELQDFPTVSLLFLLDADNHGIESRVSKIVKDFKSILPAITSIQLQSEKKQNLHENIGSYKKVGYHIFCEEGSPYGKLESIIKPLMEKENEAIFTAASEFIKQYQDIKRTKPKHFDPDKSVINIAGQLQRSGKANTVIISDSDYITEEKIRDNSTCQEIISLFEGIST